MSRKLSFFFSFLFFFSFFFFSLLTEVRQVPGPGVPGVHRIGVALRILEVQVAGGPVQVQRPVRGRREGTVHGVDAADFVVSRDILTRIDIPRIDWLID